MFYDHRQARVTLSPSLVHFLKLLGPCHPARVRRHYHHVILFLHVAAQKVVHCDQVGLQVVNRHIGAEKPLNLAAMQIDCHHSINSHCL